MNNFGLNTNTITLIKNLFQDFEQVEKVKIFGSRAKGNFKNSSDIDFALYGEINEKLLLDIASELDELPTPYKFDIVNYNDIENENLKQSIDKFGKDFYTQKAEN